MLALRVGPPAPRIAWITRAPAAIGYTPGRFTSPATCTIPSGSPGARSCTATVPAPAGTGCPVPPPPAPGPMRQATRASASAAAT